MLKIRLKRIGRKKKAVYKIVVMESLTHRDGKAICNLGFYNPQAKLLKFNKKLLLQYIENGAYFTHTLRHIILNYK